MNTNPDGLRIASLAAENPWRNHGTKTLIKQVYKAVLKNMQKDTLVAWETLNAVLVIGAW